MVSFTRRTVLLLGLALPSLFAVAEGPKQNAPTLTVKLGKIPNLRLAPRPALSATEAERIKALIAGLAALDKPDFGLSATLSGSDFAPLPGQRRAGAMLLTDHKLRPAEGLKALVTLGPDALPFLLAALDDKTPTKITIEHGGGFGIMYHASELHLNPVNPSEVALYKARVGKARDEHDHVASYRVKVGDVCFVAIGQIVGRKYQAVRYQPTACIVLNSPVHDPKLCAEVRAVWKSKDMRAKLFDSLLADYATEGIFNGENLNGWYAGSDSQCAAALRLLFYFEKESAGLVAGRLDELDVGKGRGVDGWMHRCVANGVRPDEFLKAVSWSKAPAVRASLLKMFERAEDPRELLAVLPTVEDEALIRKRLEKLVRALPADEGGPYGDGYELLLALARRTPKTARPVFERYLCKASAQRCHTVCLVLRKMKSDWGATLLGPLLTDERTWGWDYAVKPGKDEPRRPIRVCDEAAVTLSQNHPELKFTRAGEHAALDEQIEAIRKQLAKKK